jgi:4-aminobutyrate aminotransferase/(S)-3-amino-2-methylpropionate transaminase
VLVEPILGRGGVIVPPPSFLGELRSLTLRAGALLVADEVWTGLGRSGRWLASTGARSSEGRGVVPDVVCLGKGLGGGMPISACIGADEVMQAWRRDPPDEVVHTATFFGAPLACSAAVATLDALHVEKLDERARDLGARTRAALATALGTVPGAGDVRGAGLMIGISLGNEATALAVQRSLLAAGYIVTLGGLSSEVLVLTPPLTIAERLLDGFTTTLLGLLESASPSS